MKMIKFYDTSSLLLLMEHIEKEQDFVISSITLDELEHIKTSNSKDAHTKYAARYLLNYLTSHAGLYTVWIFTSDMLSPIESKSLEITNDMKILATAIHYEKVCAPDNVQFITNDLAQYNIANLFFGADSIDMIHQEQQEEYDGYKEIVMTDDMMVDFYSNQDKNLYNLNINEYLLIYDSTNKLVDTLCWTGAEYRHLTYKPFTSDLFGTVKPLQGDIYQALAADSLINNQITMLKGKAGTGKTWLALGYLIHLLEKNKIDKIIVFCNTVATKGSAKLGFYPGTRDEKLLDSQIGNLLISKLGGRVLVEQMLQQEKIVLLPLSDIRGYDTSGMNAGIYISEAQNIDIELM